MRPLFFLLFSFSSLLLYSQAKTTAYSIKGFLPYWKGASFTLSIDGVPLESQTLQQDVYSYIGQVTQAQPGLLEIKYGGKLRFLPFFIEPGVIRIRDKGSKRLEVYGTPTNDSFLALNHTFDSLVLNGGNASAGEAMITKKGLAKSYIRAHPRSIISLQLLYDYFFLHNSLDDTAYIALFDILAPTLQQTALGQKIGKEVALSSRSAPGARAALMSLPDSAGALQPVYTKGKYTLVHFWASWCVPCKKEFPKLSALYQRFAPLGLSLTGVSVDRNRPAWKRAVHRLPGKQLIDVGSFTGVAAMKYGIKVVPMNLLLDREGTIIAKNLSMPALEEKLSKLLPTTF